MGENGTKIRDREKQVVVEALRIERANARRDTVKQKSRGEVSGGGVKPWRQKGTGRARQGSIRAVQWRGGGRAFNTDIENHHRKINKKARRVAVATVLTFKKESGRVIIDALQFDKPSTKQFAAFLSEHNLEGRILLVHNGNENVVKSARNLQKVTIQHQDSVTIQALLNCEWVIATPEAAQKLNIA